MNQLNLHKLPNFNLTDLHNCFLDKLLANFMAFTLSIQDGVSQGKCNFPQVLDFPFFIFHPFLREQLSLLKPRKQTIEKINL